jgi:predicted NUDIX family NTP pyrophosphohydrolase
MAAKKTAGILLYRGRDSALEVFLIHPGGPFWAKKDAGAWSVPKGEIDPGEEPLSAAKRELNEETGCSADGDFIPLAPIKQRDGKLIIVWAVEGDCDPRTVKSNTFTIEWPPRSGKRAEFPEVDRAQWFTLEAAKEKILKGQIGFLIDLQQALSAREENNDC